MTGQDARIMYQVHGLLFVVTVRGSIRIFSWSHLLVVLSTAMVSLAMANTLTDLIMSYWPGLSSTSGHYNILKYQMSMDFSSLSKTIRRLQDMIQRKPDL